MTPLTASTGHPRVGRWRRRRSARPKRPASHPLAPRELDVPNAHAPQPVRAAGASGVALGAGTPLALGVALALGATFVPLLSTGRVAGTSPGALGSPST